MVVDQIQHNARRLVSAGVVALVALTLVVLPGCTTASAYDEPSWGSRERTSSARVDGPGPSEEGSVTVAPSGSRPGGVRPRHLGPLFVDWWYQAHVDHKEARLPTRPSRAASSYIPPFRYASPYTYVPMPQPGGQHGIGFTGWMSWARVETTRRVAESGAPVVLLYRERNSPFPYKADGRSTDPGSLRDALAKIDRLDYIVLDLEHDQEMIEKNIQEILRIVRTHPNPLISNAWVGNYNDYAGRYDPAGVWEAQRDRSALRYHGEDGRWDRDTYYRRSGMNMAMPDLYPREAYSRHTEPQSGGRAPNDRAALLWAPMARMALAKRELPAGHKLVPWICNYGKYTLPDPKDMYNAEAPPREDLEALVRHVYLRGADGFVVWTPNRRETYHPSVSHDEYRNLALGVWASMDRAMGSDLRNEREVLELGADKSSGVIVSAARFEGTTMVLVSNLSGRDRAFDLSGYHGSLGERVGVPDGSHELFVVDPDGAVRRGR